MQPSYLEIKKAALKSLKNRWPEAIAASVTFIAVAMLDTFFQYILMLIFKVDAVWSPFSPTTMPLYNTVFSIGITLFSACYTVAVILPLFFGVMKWFWTVSGGGNSEIIEIFHYFSSPKKFWRSAALSFGIFWRAALGAVICFLPFILSKVMLSPDFYNFFGYGMPIWVSGLFPLKTLFKVLGFVLFIFWIFRYILFYSVMFYEPDLSAHAVLKKTVKVAKGRTLHIAGFVFSFIGWIFLSFLCLPMIFTVPFMLSSFAVYGREEYRLSMSKKEN